MIVFKDYSIDRAGEMKHVSEYSSQAWLNARDRRHSRRTEQAEETDKTLEKANA
jgi:mannose-1-phosphate guanylyltransferase